jgi:hypothetical protein
MSVQSGIQMENSKVLVIDWHGKRYITMKIHMKLLAIVGKPCPSCATITSCIRTRNRGVDIHHHESHGVHLPDERIDSLIAKTLEETHFHSVHPLANTLKISQATIWRYLHSAGYVVPNLRIISHSLSRTQKAARVVSAIRLRKVLSSAKQGGRRVRDRRRVRDLFHDKSSASLGFGRSGDSNETELDDRQSQTTAQHFLVPARFSSCPNSPKEISL